MDHEAPAGVTSAIAGVEQIAAGFEAGLQTRFEGLGNIPAELDRLGEAVAAADTSIGLLIFGLVVVSGVAGGVFFLVERQFGEWAKPGGWRPLLVTIAAALLSVTAGLIAAGLLAAPGLPTRTLRFWAVLAAVGCLVVVMLRALLGASRAPAPHRSRR